MDSVLPLLKSSRVEEKMAGMMLLSKAFDPTKVDMQQCVDSVGQPFLLSLLGSSDDMATEVALGAVAVFAESDSVSFQDPHAMLPLVFKLLGSHPKQQSQRDALRCAFALIAFMDSCCIEALCLLITEPKCSQLPGCISLLARLVDSSANVPAELLVKLVGPLAHFFSSSQTEEKFAALRMLSLALSRPNAADPGNRVAVQLCRGLTDVLRIREHGVNRLTAMQVCLALLTLRADGKWMLDQKNSSRAPLLMLLMGLIGVEVAMVFEAPKIAQADAAATYLAILEAIMYLLVRENNGLESLSPDLILAIREKLCETLRVCLVWLSDSERESDERMEQACSRAVGVLVTLDPDAYKPSELAPLLPMMVKRRLMPLYAGALSMMLSESEEIRAEFIALGGMQEILGTLERNVHLVKVMLTAEETATWDSCAEVPIYDTLISLYSSFLSVAATTRVSLDGLRPNLFLDRMIEYLEVLSRYPAGSDEAGLLGFVASVMAYCLLSVSAEGNDAGVVYQTVSFVASYCRRAVEEDAGSVLMGALDVVVSEEGPIAPMLEAKLKEVGFSIK